MLHRGDPNVDEEVPIELDDPLEPFKDWIDIFFMFVRKISRSISSDFTPFLGLSIHVLTLLTHPEAILNDC